jgi:hypothetical protein
VFGVVAAGARSDLVLLKRSPLADVCSYADPAGVMLGDRWLPERELDDLLARLIAARNPGAATVRLRSGRCPGPRS